MFVLGSESTGGCVGMNEFRQIRRGRVRERLVGEK